MWISSLEIPVLTEKFTQGKEVFLDPQTAILLALPDS